MGNKTDISVYGAGSVDNIIDLSEQTQFTAQLEQSFIANSELDRLAHNQAFLALDNINAGYGKMEVLQNFNLRIGKGQTLCLVGPNGAGKSTVLHAIFGSCEIYAGQILLQGKNISDIPPNKKLLNAKIAYILQSNSVFPKMTVYENLLMGAYLMKNKTQVKEKIDKILDKYPKLAERRNKIAGVLSGGERRLLEISRALLMEPQVLLIDEPSIGLEPKYIDWVFDILEGLKDTENITIILVEQNAKKGLNFADIGYVLVAGKLAMAASGKDLLKDKSIGRLFLGGV